jgi:hypothetical protein
VGDLILLWGVDVSKGVGQTFGAGDIFEDFLDAFLSV